MIQKIGCKSKLNWLETDRADKQEVSARTSETKSTTAGGLRTPRSRKNFSKLFITFSETKNSSVVCPDQRRWCYTWKLKTQTRIFSLAVSTSTLQTSSCEYLNVFGFLAFSCPPSYIYDGRKASILCAGVLKRSAPELLVFLVFHHNNHNSTPSTNSGRALEPVCGQVLDVLPVGNWPRHK